MKNDITHVLGKNTTEYKEHYAPDYLAREARQGNREQYGIEEGKLPFIGWDIWHAYEASFLYGGGYPATGILKLDFPADSKYIVESKSLKLYLFSFAMDVLGSTIEEATAKYEDTIRKDLEELLECSIELKFVSSAGLNSNTILEHPAGMPLHGAVEIEELIDVDTLKPLTEYTENPELLKEKHSLGHSTKKLLFYTDALKSNCKITHQADYGTVYIDYEGDSLIDLSSIYRYVVSFRGENHFHEEIVECMYKRIFDEFKPRKLSIMAFYTRRGGIDICPMRSNIPETCFDVFRDIYNVTYRSPRS
jgi:7-cyano-7-deazaguanine reductase